MKITHIAALTALIAASTTTTFAGRGPEVRFVNDSRTAPIVKQMDAQKKMQQQAHQQARGGRSNQRILRSTLTMHDSPEMAQCSCALKK